MNDLLCVDNIISTIRSEKSKLGNKNGMTAYGIDLAIGAIESLKKLKKNNGCQCGCSEITVKTSEVMDGFYVECIECESSSASCCTIQGAIDDWNEMQKCLNR